MVDNNDLFVDDEPFSNEDYQRYVSAKVLSLFLIRLKWITAEKVQLQSMNLQLT